MDRYLEGRTEAAKMSRKYYNVVRKRRKICRGVQKAWLSRGISSTFIVRGCPSISPFSPD